MQYKIAKIDMSHEEYLSRLTHHEYFAEKVKGMKPESRRYLEVLAVRYLLKEMLGEEQVILYDEDGTPYFQYRQQGKEFLSISHTDGFAAVVVGDKPVGIDIERRGRRVERVKSHFLQECEETLVTITAHDNSEEFMNTDDIAGLGLHLIWSAKEAAYKVLGPRYFDLQNLTCVRDIDYINKVIKMEVVGKGPLTIHFEYTKDYVLCYLISD